MSLPLEISLKNHAVDWRSTSVLWSQANTCGVWWQIDCPSPVQVRVRARCSVLCGLCTHFLSLNIESVLICLFVYFTVTNLYMWGTTCKLGAGQAVFRQRAAHIWAKVAQWCRRLNKGSDSKAQTGRM